MEKNLLICGFLVSLMISSCCVYHPQTTDIPLIKNKHDLRLDAGFSVIPTVHATISYGLTKTIAIQAFGSIGSDNFKYFQIAPGLYKDFGNNRVMELYGGFGSGYGDAYKDSNPGRMYGDYQLYFLQYNLGKYSTKSGYFDFGFGIKTGYFHSNLNEHNYYHDKPGSENEPFINYKENSILVEPLAFFRVGGEKVKFSFKVGGCKIIKLAHPDIYIPACNLNVGFGINFSPKMNKGDIKKQE
jgi:hypothetical protein